MGEVIDIRFKVKSDQSSEEAIRENLKDLKNLYEQIKFFTIQGYEAVSFTDFLKIVLTKKPQKLHIIGSGEICGLVLNDGEIMFDLYDIGRYLDDYRLSHMKTEQHCKYFERISLDPIYGCTLAKGRETSDWSNPDGNPQISILNVSHISDCPFYDSGTLDSKEKNFNEILKEMFGFTINFEDRHFYPDFTDLFPETIST